MKRLTNSYLLGRDHTSHGAFMNMKVKDVRVLGSISEKLPMGSNLQKVVLVYLNTLPDYLLFCFLLAM